MTITAVVLASLASLATCVMAGRTVLKGRSDTQIKDADDAQTLAYLSREFTKLDSKLNQALERLSRIEGQLWRGRR